MRKEKKKRLIVKFDYEINYESFDSFLDFLLEREDNIATDIENFGLLKEIFKDLFEADAKRETE